MYDYHEGTKVNIDAYPSTKTFADFRQAEESFSMGTDLTRKMGGGGYVDLAAWWEGITNPENGTSLARKMGTEEIAMQDKAVARFIDDTQAATQTGLYALVAVGALLILLIVDRIL